MFAAKFISYVYFYCTFCIKWSACLIYRVQGHLGSGQFGSVEKGIWRVENQSIKIALKTLNQSSTAENKMKFLQEAAIMAQFRHPNVILLYGIITNDEPVS